MSKWHLILCLTGFTGLVMQAANPASIPIARPPGEVCAEIVRLYRVEKLRDYVPMDKTGANSYLKKYYFTKPDTENDVYLHSIDGRLFGDSEVYYYRSKKCSYYADFVFQVRTSDTGSTLLSVVAIEPEASRGREFNIHTFGLSIKKVPVKPTGYEEYILALRVAKSLGVEDQPEPIIPARISLDDM